MTIVLSNKKVIEAIGTHGNKNCKPVFCITTGEVFASVTDAANANHVDISSMAKAISKGTPTRGKYYCFLSKCAEHIDVISKAIQTNHPKAIAYDAIIARQEAVRKANETYDRARNTVLAKKEALRKIQLKYTTAEVELRDAERMLAEAEAEVKKLQN